MPQGIKDFQPIHVHVPTTGHQEDKRADNLSSQSGPYEAY